MIRGVWAGFFFLTLSGAAAAASSPLVEAATRYAQFQDDVAALDRPAGPEDLDAALRMTARYGPERLARAWLGFAGLLGAQSTPFADAVRSTAEHYGRDMVLAGMAMDPQYAARIDDAEHARAMLTNTLAQDAQWLSNKAALYSSYAYDLQSADWALERASDPLTRDVTLLGAQDDPQAVLEPQRLGAIEAPASPLAQLDPLFRAAFAAQFERAFPARLSAAEPMGLAVSAPTAHGAVAGDLALSLSALIILEAPPETAAAHFDTILGQASAKRCFEWAHAHMRECLAAARFSYEEPFCTGRHALGDVAACLTDIGEF
ncbi:MAG: hypothetical protein ACFB2Z_02805 [Maricaulaceae bacterium]